MKKIVILLLMFCASFTLLNAENERDTLYILNTTDIHGSIIPYDYINDEPAEYGLVKIYSRIKEFKEKYDNVVLLDCGDLLQGTPYAYYFNRIDTTGIHPIIQTFNYIGYDAFAVGNHEIELGVDTYTKARDNSDFPWLSANAALDGEYTYFEPYTILGKGGIKIGILGLTTPGIPTMLDSTYYPGITWKDMVITAQQYAPKLRDSVDVLIGIFHAGFDAEEDKYKEELFGLPVANASKLVAERVPGFDVVFGGHSHRVNPRDTTITVRDSTTLQMISGAHAWGLGIAKIILEKHDTKWEIIEKTGWIEQAKDFAPSQEILEINEPYHKKVISFFKIPIALNKEIISTENARFEDSPIPELINRVQLHHTGADISISPAFSTGLVIPADTIRIKDVYAMYPYENTLKMIEMTGKQLVDYLEYCANYYVYENDSLSTNPEIAGYNYDMAEGISYIIDVREQPGSRIKDVTFLKTSKPLDPEITYTVALNSYRANGGGGHLKAVGIDEPKVLYSSKTDLRNLIIDYLMEQEIFEAKCDNNWN
ncbi:MAG: 5'-nucleotidase C-terminal domain-containing protein, partial [Candidatus Cloacimonetes bacterium]|nr:5'-nucleotidase C-terminal domain-containing protein [Candidatus Cloacimonadota bacterium]